MSGGTTVDTPGYVKLGSDTRIHGSHSLTVVDGADGEDQFTVWYLQSMNVAAGHTLVLDGQAETDTYRVYTSGSRGSSRNYVAHVLDTGAPDDGVDELYVHGFASATEGYVSPGNPHPVDDIFLLRRVTSIAGEVADRPAFVALLHTTLGVAAPTGVSTLSTSAFDVERIGYDTAVNGRVTVYGLSGNDYFASDDTSAVVTLDGGSGNDTFQIGQIYGLQRDATEYTGTTPTNTTGVTTGGSLAPSRRLRHHRDDPRLAERRREPVTRGPGRHRRRHLRRVLQPGPAAARGRRRQRPVRGPCLRPRPHRRQR